MATSKQGKKTIYPVWVGNLHDCVTESMLKQKFSGFGCPDSCTIMKDEQGRPRNFGYVNFTSKSVADNAAKKLHGKELALKPMKTKGPSALKKEGYLKNQSKNYRPLTDCTFFMEGKGCTKGDQCPYRHSERARLLNTVCIDWMNRSCRKKKCPQRHPRLSESHSPVKARSDSKLSMNFSDSDDDSIDFQLGDISDSSSLSGVSNSFSDSSPSPGTRKTSGDIANVFESSSSPFSNRSNKSNGNRPEYKMLGSTQSFSVSSDEEDLDLINDINYRGNEVLSAYDSTDDDEDDDYIDDDDDMPTSSLSRLTSLTESRVKKLKDEEDYEPDDEDRLKLSDSFEEGAFRKVSDQSSSSGTGINIPIPVPLEPVGLFWDIENCSVPLDKSAFALANKMRQVFLKGKREVEFMCVCDITKERKEVTDDLHRAHVTLVHVNAIAKNAADDKLKHSLRRFAQTFNPPATVVLVSGDVNFSFELNDLRHVHNMTTILVHNVFTSEALKVCAHQTVLFEEFIKDIPPQQPVAPPTSTVLLVHGLPAMDPFKVKNRLSRLADNCGGRVLNVDQKNKTARILFRSREYATKALRRINGEDVYGRKITVEIEQSPPTSRAPFAQQQPRPSFSPNPPRPNQPYTPSSNYYPPQGGPRPPHGGPRLPYGGPRPPQGGPPPSQGAPFPPFGGPHPRGPLHGVHRGPFPIQQPPQLPYQHMVPHPQQAVAGYRLFISGLSMSVEAEFDNLTAIFTEVRLSVNIKAAVPQFYWESFSKASLLSDFHLPQTAEMRRYQPVLYYTQANAPIPGDVAKGLVDVCLGELNKACKVRSIPWTVSLCRWTSEEDENKKIISNVISLLKKYEKHWAKLDKFRYKYAETFNSPLSEMMIQQSCGNAIQILSASSSDTVILFVEFSPLIRIRKTDEFMKNSLSLLESLPGNKIKLLEFVEAYLRRFDKSTMKKGKTDLQEIFSSSPPFYVSGNKPSALVVGLRSSSPVDSNSRPKHRTPSLEAISREFVNLLKEMPGEQVSLNRIQQEYQTKYHRSFRVSDILPGTSGVKALVDACSGIKCIPVSYGKKKESIVVLTQASPSPSNGATPQDTAHKPDVLSQQEGLSPIECFRRDMVDLLRAQPNGSLRASSIPEEYTKHFKKPYLLSNYGGKKTINLLKKIPDVIMIDQDGEERIVHLIGIEVNNEADCHMSKEQCERKIEEMLYHRPNHSTTLDRFLHHYEAYYNEKLTDYCGHAKLLALLQEMRSTVEINGSGCRRDVQLLPLRVFALHMKALLSDHPEGMKLSCVVPEYTKKFGVEFNATTYGKTKLLQVMESIPDIVKITGEGPRRIVSLMTGAPSQPSPPSKPSSSQSSQPPSATPKTVSEARQMFLDEVISLLFSYEKKELTLEKLSQRYFASFKKPIDFKELGYSSTLEAVQNLPNVKVSGEGFSAIVQLSFDETPSPEPPKAVKKRVEPEDNNDSRDSLMVVKQEETGTDDVAAGEVQESTDQPINETAVKPKPRLCQTICVRLLSEMYRILLMHHEHSMTLVELCTSFKEAEEPSQPTPEDLMAAIETYSGKEYKFHVSKIVEDYVLVSLPYPDIMSKLSKDLCYLFVYCPSPDFTVSLDRLQELYKECYNRRLNPMVYKRESIEDLLKSKPLSHAINFNEQQKSVSLMAASRIEVFIQLACEMLFRMEPECGHVDKFVACYNKFFNCPLLLAQLQVSSLKDLMAKPGVDQYIEFKEGSGHITLSSRGLYGEQLRHLLTVHDGRIVKDLLLALYLSEFRHPPQDSEIISWLRNDPVEHASHIVHNSSDYDIVWAVTGRPYPDTRTIKYSTLLPEERSSSVSEVSNVSDIVTNIMKGDAPKSPSISLTLPLSGDIGDMIDDSSVLFPPNEHFKGFDEPIPDLLATNNSTGTGSTTGSATGVEDQSNDDLITGLDHGEFAGLTHQSVLAKMKQELRGEESSGMDSSAKIKRMGDFLDYFGELSERELNRVNPPVPKPRKNKPSSSRSRLAIQFPGASSNTSQPNEDGSSSSSGISNPKTSPILGVQDISNQGSSDCLPQSSANSFIGHPAHTMGVAVDWEKQLMNPPQGVSDATNKESSPGAAEWPSL